MNILLTGAACALTVVLAAHADDKPPVPKVYQGMGTQKGQWKVDWLEAPEMKAGQRPSMTICSDNLANQARQNAAAAKAQSDCRHKVVKDTPSEAIVESTCKDHTMTLKTTREDDKTLILQMDGKTSGGRDTHARLRYTYLGPCREGQGALSLDKNSEQCRKLRERAAKMDPEKQKQLTSICN